MNLSMPKDKERIVAVAGVNGKDYCTCQLIRNALTEAHIWSSAEGSCGVDILVRHTDAACATDILRNDKRLVGRIIWFLPKPVFVARYDASQLAKAEPDTSPNGGPRRRSAVRKSRTGRHR